DRLAVLRVYERGRFLAGAGDLPLPCTQALRAAVESEGPPGLCDLAGGGDGRGCLLLARHRVPGQFGPGGLIDGDELRPIESDDSVTCDHRSAVCHGSLQTLTPRTRTAPVGETGDRRGRSARSGPLCGCGYTPTWMTSSRPSLRFGFDDLEHGFRRP